TGSTGATWNWRFQVWICRVGGVFGTHHSRSGGFRRLHPPYQRLMAILIEKSKRVLVQGITGREGQARARLMLDYGTQLVGGVTPGKGGQMTLGVPVFNTAHEA